MRWDSSKEQLPTMRKEEPTRELQKSLHLVSIRGKDKVCGDESLIVGLPKGKMVEKFEVRVQ